MSTPIVPQIHLNGTSRDALISQSCEVLDSLRKLKATLTLGAPHPRDFQLSGGADYNDAFDDWLQDYDAVTQLTVKWNARLLALAEQGENI